MSYEHMAHPIKLESVLRTLQMLSLTGLRPVYDSSLDEQDDFPEFAESDWANQVPKSSAEYLINGASIHVSYHKRYAKTDRVRVMLYGDLSLLRYVLALMQPILEEEQLD